MELDIVAEIRRFNRFYTRRIGLLDQTLTGSAFTLAEARVLHEIGQAGNAPSIEITATDIVAALGLDPAYLARILKRLSATGIVRSERDRADGRRRILSLTDAGRDALAALQAATDRQIGDLAGPMSGFERGELAQALRSVERLLGSRPAVAPVALRPHAIGDVGWVIERQSKMYARDYGWNHEYEAMVCEIGAKFLREFRPGREYCWIAERSGERLGAVFLVERSVDVAQLRMLHVERAARGQGIGSLLVETCIETARRCGYKRMMLWTNDVLREARRLYERAGFRLVSQDDHHSFGHDLHGQNWEREL